MLNFQEFSSRSKVLIFKALGWYAVLKPIQYPTMKAKHCAFLNLVSFLFIVLKNIKQTWHHQKYKTDLKLLRVWKKTSPTPLSHNDGKVVCPSEPDVLYLIHHLRKMMKKVLMKRNVRMHYFSRLNTNKIQALRFSGFGRIA